jgi:hypothetical protein
MASSQSSGWYTYNSPNAGELKVNFKIPNYLSSGYIASNLSDDDISDADISDDESVHVHRPNYDRDDWISNDDTRHHSPEQHDIKKESTVNLDCPFRIKELDMYFVKNTDPLQIDESLVIKQDPKKLDEVKCPVCLCVFNDPHCLECTHTFCKNCVDNLEVDKCPLCRNKFSYGSIIQKSALKKEIDKWSIKCDKCNKVHKIFSKCTSLYICKICSQQVIKNNRLNHLEKECGDNKDGIIRKCTLCNEKAFQLYLDGKHKDICTKRTIKCTYCNTQIQFDKFKKHSNKCVELSKQKIGKEMFKDNQTTSHQLKYEPIQPKTTGRDEIKQKLQDKLKIKLKTKS